jgi:carboxyvinyl-carboxyphosphonate phosphorylmutase
VGLRALHDAMKAMKDGTISSQLPGQASKELLERSLGAADYERWTREFLGAA